MSPSNCTLNEDSTDKDLNILTSPFDPSKIHFKHIPTQLIPAIQVTIGENDHNKNNNQMDLKLLGLVQENNWDNFNKQFEYYKLRMNNNDEIKCLYLVRHAIGLHNVAESKFGTEKWEAEEALKEIYSDPELSEQGQKELLVFQQCVNDALSRGLKVDCIIVSPLSRAIETALTAFNTLIGKVPFVCMETCRETLGRHLCDKRRNRSELQQKYPMVNFKWLLSEEDKMFSYTHRETENERIQRAALFLNSLFELTENYENIVISTSGGIIRSMTQVMNQFYNNNEIKLNGNYLPNSEVTQQFDSLENFAEFCSKNNQGYITRNCEMLPVMCVKSTIFNVTGKNNLRSLIRDIQSGFE